MKQFVTSGWPASHFLKGEINQFGQLRHELCIHDNLLLGGSRIVIPASLRGEILSTLHTSHQGNVKCRERARQSVWWPRLSTQVEEMVQNCPTCAKHHFNHAEPLIPTSLPDLPWQKVATDLYVRKEHTYILIVDYYLRYIETALLRDTTSEGVIQQLKSIFARHGIPEQVISDNGPQFSSRAFSTFAKTYGFMHITSSPNFPQANGEAERAVKTVKNLLEKAEDPYLAMLAYRSTPLQNGYSPSELLMNRRLRSNVPMIRDLLKPHIPKPQTLQRAEKKKMYRMKSDHDRRHDARDLTPLSPGTQVWVQDQLVYGNVVEQPESNPRSYMIETPRKVIRRNRRHLNTIPNTGDNGTPEGGQMVTSQQTSLAEDPPAGSTTPAPTSSPNGDIATERQVERQTVVLRSGRISNPPERLDL